MKFQLALALFLAPLAAFAATGPVPLGPNHGRFGDWTAATYKTGAAKVCYAFTHGSTSSVLLTVTERKLSHDEVSITAKYPDNATVTLKAKGAKINFYTKGGTAFTSDGPNAVALFGKAKTAVAASSAGGKADNFSLTGFTGAYKAIVKACK
jgi:hypothetical protein